MNQTSIPGFHGLLPEPFDNAIATLLYRVCTCHALAKLRLHTDATVDHLQRSVAAFAADLRKMDGCLQNIPSKGGRKTKSLKKQSGNTNQSLTNTRPTLNRNTVKLHSIADYPRSILRYGSVDSYSTFLVCVPYRCYTL